MFRYTLIHALVSTTDEHNAIESRQFGRNALGKSLDLRRKKHHRMLRPSRNSIFAWREMHRLQTFKERLRLEHHALAAAERAVIHGAVLVVRELPQIVDFDFRQAHLAGPAGNSVIQWPTEKAGKNRQ